MVGQTSVSILSVGCILPRANRVHFVGLGTVPRCFPRLAVPGNACCAAKGLVVDDQALLFFTVVCPMLRFTIIGILFLDVVLMLAHEMSAAVAKDN